MSRERSRWFAECAHRPVVGLVRPVFIIFFFDRVLFLSLFIVATSRFPQTLPSVSITSLWERLG